MTRIATSMGAESLTVANHFFDAIRTGTTLLVGADPLWDRLSPGAVAAQSLITALSVALNAGQALLLRGHGEFSESSIHLLIQQQAIHELAWTAAGHASDLLDSPSATNHDWTHIVYLDPWAANLDAQIRARWPRSQRYLLDDCHARRAISDTDYWEAMDAWIEQLTLTARIDVRVVIDRWSGDWWTSVIEGRDGVFAPETGKGDSSHIIIDETMIQAPIAGVTSVVTARWPEHQIIVLTPHIDHYHDNETILIDRRVQALRVADLSPRVFATLQSKAAAYIAPAGSALGCHSLRFLPVGSNVHVPHGQYLPGHLAPYARYHHHVDDLIRQLSLPAPEEPTRSSANVSPLPTNHVFLPNDPSPVPIPSSPQLSQWWKKLSSLSMGNATYQKTIRLSAESAPVLRSESALPDLSILTCCYKYFQRFRVFINSIIRQDYPLERLEVCVASPGNPDGLRDYLDLLRQVYPQLRVLTVELPDSAHTNKGKMLNQVFDRSSAPIVMVTDCDLVLPPNFLRTVMDTHRPDEVLGCWRTPMGPATTARILVGDLDPVLEYDALRQQWDESETAGGVRQGLLGYCQIVTRTAFAKVRYPEEFPGFSQSDIVFIDRLREQAGIKGNFRKDLFLLHLSHLRDWSGTKVFL